MRLSIAMIVKNEESNIERSLKAIRKLDNKIEYEIVIVDTGSTDRTIEIAKKYTDKVYCHKWNGSFGDMRNISIKYCKGDWILVLDADEVIEDEEEIVKFLNSEDSKKYNAAEINFKNLLSEDTSNYLVATLFRLFKNIKEFYYVGKIHEQPRVVEPYTISKITVFHYGYSREDYELMKYKYERNKKLLLEDIKNGVEPIYSRFQLAQTYSMANMHREALETIKEAYKLDQIRKDGMHNINVYHFYSRELLSRCNYEMANKVANEGIDYCDSSLDLYYVVAISNSYMNNISEANKGYDKYFEIRDAKEKGTFKAKTLGGTSLADYSYCRLEEMLNNYIRFNYNNKMYLNVIDKIETYEETLESDENKMLYYCSLIKTSKVDKFIKCINNKNKDSDIQLIINVLEKIDSEEANINIKDIIKKILGIDHKLDSVLNLIYFKKKNKLDDINYEEYYGWKTIVFNEQLQNDSKEIDKLKNCSGVIQNYYLTSAINNYECLSILYNYSEENLLKTNLQELSFINNLDRTLICSPSIDKEKFNDLVIRIFINHLWYLKKVYRPEILSLKEKNNILEEFYNMILMVRNIIINSKNKLEYIKDFKKLIKEYSIYNKILKVFIQNISEEPISDEMIKEKTNLLKVVEEYYYLGKVEEGFSILNELEQIFNNDIDIINLKGVGYYYLGNYKKALINLAFVYEMKEDKFEAAYNIAMIFEEIKRNDDAKYFYNVAFNLCKDNEIKKEIEQKLK